MRQAAAMKLVGYSLVPGEVSDDVKDPDRTTNYKIWQYGRGLLINIAEGVL